MAFWNWPEAIGCWQIELKEQDVVLRAEEKKTTALLEKATVWFKREGISWGSCNKWPEVGVVSNALGGKGKTF